MIQKRHFWRFFNKNSVVANKRSHQIGYEKIVHIFTMWVRISHDFRGHGLGIMSPRYMIANAYAVSKQPTMPIAVKHKHSHSVSCQSSNLLCLLCRHVIQREGQNREQSDQIFQKESSYSYNSSQQASWKNFCDGKRNWFGRWKAKATVLQRMACLQHHVFVHSILCWTE